MWFLTVAASIILSLFSTAVMSYISMATPIGPWIAPTLVLFAMLFFHFLLHKKAVTSDAVMLATCSGSIGGILATAFGFSFPTLYFLKPELFNSWMAEPLYFAFVLGALAIVAGWFGIWVANVIENKVIVQEQLAFPIGQLVYKMIAAQNQVRKAYELLAGFVGTAFFCIMQDGICALSGFIPKDITITTARTVGVFSLPAFKIDLFPMLWAIGFVTGHVIALPLAVGALSKILIVDPLNNAFFSSMSGIDFLLAFCTGLIIASTISSFIESPKMLWRGMHGMYKKLQSGSTSSSVRLTKEVLIEIGALLIVTVLFLTYFNFSLLAQLYLILFTFMCTHEIAIQAGKIGLARLGMFATFVMVPALLIFKLDAVQIVLVATFVEICGGVAADALAGRKIAYMANIPSYKMKAYQYLGLLVSALCIGGVFWLLINHFTLGSPQLFAQKAKNRQLLIDSQQFNYVVLIFGFIFGYLLKKVRVNPSLVLGGLLMPLNISVGLIIGGMFTFLTKEKEEWYPFWSGVFASNSIWMLVKAIL